MPCSEALPQNAADVKAKLAAERGVAAIAARSDSETDTLVTALVDGVAICGRSALEAIKSSDSTKRSVAPKDEQTATDYSMALGSQPVQSSSVVPLADTQQKHTAAKEAVPTSSANPLVIENNIKPEQSRDSKGAPALFYC